MSRTGVRLFKPATLCNREIVEFCTGSVALLALLLGFQWIELRIWPSEQAILTALGSTAASALSFVPRVPPVSWTPIERLDLHGYRHR